MRHITALTPRRSASGSDTHPRSLTRLLSSPEPRHGHRRNLQRVRSQCAYKGRTTSTSEITFSPRFALGRHIYRPYFVRARNLESPRPSRRSLLAAPKLKKMRRAPENDHGLGRAQKISELRFKPQSSRRRRLPRRAGLCQCFCLLPPLA